MAAIALDIRPPLKVTAVAIFSSIMAAHAEPAPAPLPQVIVVAAQALDVRSGHYLRDAGVYIEGDRIKNVGSSQTVIAHAPATVAIINLRNATVLPGLKVCTVTDLFPRSAPRFLDAANHLSASWECDHVWTHSEGLILANCSYSASSHQHARSVHQPTIYCVSQRHVRIT